MNECKYPDCIGQGCQYTPIMCPFDPQNQIPESRPTVHDPDFTRGESDPLGIGSAYEAIELRPASEIEQERKTVKLKKRKNPPVVFPDANQNQEIQERFERCYTKLVEVINELNDIRVLLDRKG